MGVTLNGSQLYVVLAALEDAAEYRLARGNCDQCESAAFGQPDLCDDHKADIQRGIRYASLALRLEKAAGHE